MGWVEHIERWGAIGALVLIVIQFLAHLRWSQSDYSKALSKQREDFMEALRDCRKSALFIPLALLFICIGGCASQGTGSATHEESITDPAGKNTYRKDVTNAPGSAAFLNSIHTGPAVAGSLPAESFEGYSLASTFGRWAIALVCALVALGAWELKERGLAMGAVAVGIAVIMFGSVIFIVAAGGLLAYLLYLHHAKPDTFASLVTRMKTDAQQAGLTLP